MEGVKRKNGRRGKRWRGRERVRKSNDTGGAGGEGCSRGKGRTCRLGEAVQKRSDGTERGMSNRTENRRIGRRRREKKKESAVAVENVQQEEDKEQKLSDEG